MPHEKLLDNIFFHYYDQNLQLYDDSNYITENLIRNKLKYSMIPIRPECL